MYPQSNGLAERTVRTVKSTLEKARQDKRDPNLALEHRNTSVDGIGSPAQMCMGRRLRSSMPSTMDQLGPITLDPQIVQRKLERKQVSQKKYYNRSSKPLADLEEGDQVRVQQQGKWKPAVVVSRTETPRSYNVMSKSEAEYRRNRIHLRKSEEDRVPFTSDSHVTSGEPKEVLTRKRAPPNDHSRDALVNQDQSLAPRLS